MIASLAAGFLAGAFSTLSPCVLPLLPVVLTGSLQRSPFAPLALAGGLALSFSVLGVFLASLGFAFDVDPEKLRVFAALLLMLFGAILIGPRLQSAFSHLAAPLAARADTLLSRIAADGPGGQFLLGAMLGLAWSPCAGPTLGAALGLAANSGTVPAAAGVLGAFSLGAVAPLLALAYGSRQAVRRRKNGLAQFVRWGKPIMGAGLLAVGARIISGGDKVVETRLTDTMPHWLVTLATRF